MQSEIIQLVVERSVEKICIKQTRKEMKKKQKRQSQNPRLPLGINYLYSTRSYFHIPNFDK